MPERILKIKLDEESFRDLDRIKERKGDLNYTISLKRAIAYLNYIYNQEDQGREIYVGKDGELIDKLVEQDI